MGWEEDHVEKIIRRYVGRNAATRTAIASSIAWKGAKDERTVQNRLKNRR
jgi:hypothetical protein